MKLFLIIVLCTILLFMMLGYSQFKTTTIEELKGDKSFFGKTVIVEGFVYRNSILFLVTKPEIYTANTRMPYDQYIWLTGNTKFLPHRGMSSNHVRVKGIVVEPEFLLGSEMSIEVIWYGLALQEKKYTRGNNF